MIIFDDNFVGPAHIWEHVSDSGLEWSGYYFLYDEWGDPVWEPPEDEGEPPQEVDNGLINPYYPEESPLRVLNGWAGDAHIDPWTPWSTGKGDFTVTCELEFRASESELSSDVFKIGLYDSVDGYTTLIEYKPYSEEAAVSLDWGHHDPQFVSVSHLLVYPGVNVFRMHVSTHRRPDEPPAPPFRLAINGTVVQSFEGLTTYPNGRPFISLSSASPIKVKRLYISTVEPPPPVFWTDIVRAEETP